MDIKIRFLLDSNPDYRNYLRMNSYWYKILIRNPNMINDFISEYKEKNKLRTSDKINNMMDKINMVSKLIEVLR
jgi:hypothetical protein